MRLDFLMNLSDANFASANITTTQTEFLGASKSQFAQVAMLHATADKWHRNVALHAIDSHERWHQSQNASDQVDQHIRCVASVATCFPKLVQTGASDDQGRIDLQAVGTKCRILEELLNISN